MDNKNELFFAKLRGKIRELYGSERRFANYINFAPTKLSKILNGKMKMDTSIMELFIDKLEILPNEIPAYFFNENVAITKSNKNFI